MLAHTITGSHGLGFRVEGLGFRVEGSGFRVFPCWGYILTRILFNPYGFLIYNKNVKLYPTGTEITVIPFSESQHSAI